MSNHNAWTARHDAHRIRWAVCVALCLAMSPVAHGQTARVLGVHGATINDGTVGLYGIVREMPEHPFVEGTVLAVQVTAADSQATTALRREAAGEPCPDCTTTHYFLAEPDDARPEILVRLAPGPVTYIHIKGKEYMLGDIRLSWTGEDSPQLERATLLQTGFAPRIFKRRIQVHFDALPVTGTLAAEVATMAMADAMERDRLAQQAYDAAVLRESEARATP